MLKKLSIILSAILLFSFISFDSVLAYTRIKGYYRSNGTYVQPHYKTSPNKSKLDNWSTKGNSNPYTGKKGTVSPFKYRYK